jgi:hypothetical protein
MFDGTMGPKMMSNFFFGLEQIFKRMFFLNGCFFILKIVPDNLKCSGPRAEAEDGFRS